MAIQAHQFAQGRFSQFCSRVAPDVWKHYWATRLMAFSFIQQSEQMTGPRSPALRFFARKALQYQWFLNPGALPSEVQVKNLDIDADFVTSFDADVASEIAGLCSKIIDLVKDGIDASVSAPESNFLNVDAERARVLMSEVCKVLAFPEIGMKSLGYHLWNATSSAFIPSLELIGSDIQPEKTGGTVAVHKETSIAAMEALFHLCMAIRQQIAIDSSAQQVGSLES